RAVPANEQHDNPPAGQGTSAIIPRRRNRGGKVPTFRLPPPPVGKLPPRKKACHFSPCPPRTLPAQGRRRISAKNLDKGAAAFSPRGRQGQKYLAAGVHLAMRLWEDEQPGEAKPMSRRDYETVGYVIRGRAELHLEGQMVLLESGDSWVVPRGAEHTYKVL